MTTRAEFSMPKDVEDRLSTHDLVGEAPKIPSEPKKPYSAPITKPGGAKSIYQRMSEIPTTDLIKLSYNGAKYIAWADAWDRFKRFFPDAYFIVESFESGAQFQKTELGYFVGVEVFIPEGGIIVYSQSIRFPVMDSIGNPVKTPDTRDISDNQMRALVKCLALMGFGLQCWQKEDPHAKTPTAKPAAAPTKR